MIGMKLRQTIVYAATGMFFLVAAASQLQGAPLTDTVLKALVSCLVLVALGLSLVRIVEDAERKELLSVRAAHNRPASAGAEAGEQAGKTAV